MMAFRRLIPLIATLVAAYLCGGSTTRLYLLAVLLIKPLLAFAFLVSLLFIVQRSTSIGRILLRRSALWSILDFAFCRLLPRWIDSVFAAPDAPILPTRFQRPPPSCAR